MTLLSLCLYNEICLLFLHRIVSIVAVLVMTRTTHWLKDFEGPHAAFNNPHFLLIGRSVTWTTIETLNFNITAYMPTRALTITTAAS